MGDFLINTPSHKRWMLPDGIHYYNSVLYGDHFTDTVWNRLTNECVVRVPPVYIDKAGRWKETLELAQALAEKKFSKPRFKRDDGNDYVKSQRHGISRY